jgi:hypothetical protein
MFDQALSLMVQLPAEQNTPLIARLDEVRHICHNFGYAVGDTMDSLRDEYIDD